MQCRSRFPLDCWLVELRRILLRQPESPRIAAALLANAAPAALSALAASGLLPGQSAASSAFCLVLGAFHAALALVAYSTVFVRLRMSGRNRKAITFIAAMFM